MCSPAPICKLLLRQALEYYPHRDRASDGIVGDASHQKACGDHTCKSDLSCYYNPSGRRYEAGYANAVDLDTSGWPGTEFFAFTLAEARSGRRPWIKYMIHNDYIYNRYKGWKAYSGRGHFGHAHFSIEPGWTRKDVNWFAGWTVSGTKQDTNAQPVVPKKEDFLSELSPKEQRNLYNAVTGPDGATMLARLLVQHLVSTQKAPNPQAGFSVERMIRDLHYDQVTTGSPNTVAYKRVEQLLDTITSPASIEVDMNALADAVAVRIADRLPTAAQVADELSARLQS